MERPIEQSSSIQRWISWSDRSLNICTEWSDRCGEDSHTHSGAAVHTAGHSSGERGRGAEGRTSASSSSRELRRLQFRRSAAASASAPRVARGAAWCGRLYITEQRWTHAHAAAWHRLGRGLNQTHSEGSLVMMMVARPLQQARWQSGTWRRQSAGEQCANDRTARRVHPGLSSLGSGLAPLEGVQRVLGIARDADAVSHDRRNVEAV